MLDIISPSGLIWGSAQRIFYIVHGWLGEQCRRSVEPPGERQWL